MADTTEVVFDNLTRFPQHLTTLVAWHHAEWLSTVDSGSLSEEEAQAALDERLVFLQKHLKGDVIPTSFIAVAGEEPIASASLIYHHHKVPNRPPRQSLWLTNVYVIPAWRQRGLGQKMMDMAIAYCHAHGFPRLQLYTFDAAAYYLKRGWVYERTSQIRGRDVSILSVQTDRTYA